MTEAVRRAWDTLRQDPTDLEALRLIQGQCAQEERWADLAQQLERSVRHLSRKNGEQEMMLKLAMILWERLCDMERAEYYFKRLRHMNPELEPMLAFYRECDLARED